MKNTIRATALAAFALMAFAGAGATTLVDTSTSRGLSLSNSVGPTDWIAESFTLSGNTLRVDSVSALVMSLDPATDAGRSFTLAVYANDASRNLPALNFNADNQGRLFSATLTYTSDGWATASGLQWQLQPGTFWFAIESDANGPTALQVPSGATPAPVGVAYYYGHRSYSRVGVSSDDAFGLRVTAVPEPAPAALLAAGLALMGLAVRGRGAPSTATS